MADEVETTLKSGMELRSIKKYAHLRGRILACIEGMRVLDKTRAYPLDDLREKIETNIFNLVVVGQFKRGKTMLINALLGANILPVAVVPLTSIVTILKFGVALGVQVLFNDGGIIEPEPERLAEFVTETENPHNVKNVQEVVVSYPSSYLKDGVRLIDTPGVGSVYQHNTDVAYQYLPKSDAALFLLSVEQPVSKAEIDFLKDVRNYADRIFFLLNKIDYFSEMELTESIGFSRSVIEEIMGQDLKLFPISAKLALEGKMGHSDELLQKSHLPAFSEVLNKFLMHEKGKVLLLSVTNHLLKMLSLARLESELELKSLTTPLDELEIKIEAFAGKKREVLAEKQNFGILLDGDMERLIKSVLDADLAALTDMLVPEMEGHFETFQQEHRDLSLKELDNELEAYVISKVEGAFTAWRTREDEVLAAAFESICDRFKNKMDDSVDELLRFSSQLFAIPFEPTRVDSLWSVGSGFYYKFKEDAVGLDMLASSITHVLPGLVGNRFRRLKAYLFRMANRRILNKRKEHMYETINMQAGRVRYDFIERLNKGKQKLRQEMLRRMEATVEGISQAMEKGMHQRSQSEKEMKERLSALSDGLIKMDAIREELTDIKAEAAGL
jgi:GTPase Era involved in 16S rRNA processing